MKRSMASVMVSKRELSFLIMTDEKYSVSSIFTFKLLK